MNVKTRPLKTKKLLTIIHVSIPEISVLCTDVLRSLRDVRGYLEFLRIADIL
jgi:hypothetical protein